MHTLQKHLPMAVPCEVDNLLNYLVSEGFPAQSDADGDLVFKSEGLDYALCFDKDDRHFAKVILPNVWQINDQAELNQALLMLDNVNRKLKVVKGYTVKDTIWFAVEVFQTDQTQLIVFIKRIIRLLAHAARIFAAGMEFGSEQPMVVA